jgi:hypothetical protein
VSGFKGVYAYPPFFGVKAVVWESVFNYVKNPSVLWAVWRPRDLGKYKNLREVWNDWDQNRMDEDGQRPALKLVEERWGSKWGRNGTKVCLSTLLFLETPGECLLTMWTGCWVNLLFRKRSTGPTSSSPWIFINRNSTAV